MKLTLVGAGPGDPELITLKGIRALRAANVVLYDALAAEALLDYAPAEALRIFVGKRAGMHSAQQREINEMIVDYARRYGHVVRLKGGDPFVFGRGQEEKDYAELHGLTVEVVPGISSALAVPALHGIPLTERGLARSFWVVTGTTRQGSLADDLVHAARSSATVVILMGMKQLPLITREFKRHRGPHEPVAIIQNGSRPDMKMGVGNVSTIEGIVTREGLDSPAIIIVGPVVRNTQQPTQQAVEEIIRQLPTIVRQPQH
ncbi:uroporphyrin-III C-methyltransferase [Catalinimonas alkaloidigena]|uniref:uroporphyrinogen-III C-methyltransferase n=1 Tax=Catalinimonas alkaloidigena TaxID=1075417 RepID=A0A1G9R6P0_9BACT|nr:uroporphyrinogen-III C-methyltransferase [Catalinimonas alkaloidigena]SDM18790.1 uroporphyrin-III C-methyltransferase [Catalinimonas alkaloidigena]